MGAETIVEDAELEAHARQIWIDQQHALERGDGAFEVAGLARDRRKLEQHVEIGRLRQHLLEGGIVLALDIARCSRGRCAGSLTLRKGKSAVTHSGQASCDSKNPPNQFHWVKTRSPSIRRYRAKPRFYNDARGALHQQTPNTPEPGNNCGLSGSLHIQQHFSVLPISQ